MGAIDGHALRLVERRRIAMIDMGVILGVERDLTAPVQPDGHALRRHPLDRAKRAVLHP